MYKKSNEKINGLKIVRGSDLNADNNRFPNRYLLLKELSNDNFQVLDFGDFKQYNLEKLSEVYIINKDLLNELNSSIGNLLKDVGGWLKNTGNVFLIDTKQFRIMRTKP